jgi:O-antigen/teichoic acid export membrane protein
VSGTSLSALARGSAVYGTGVVVNRLLAFLLLPLFTRYLTPEEYGVMALLALVTVLCTGLFSLGTGNALPISYFAESEGPRRGTVVWSTVALLLANVVLWCVIGWWVSGHVSRVLFGTAVHAELVVLALVALGLNTIALPLSLFLRLEGRARTFVLVSLAAAFSTASVSAVLVVLLDRGVRGMLEGSVAGASVLLALSLAAVGPRLPFGLDAGSVGRVVRIGAPSIAGIGAFFILDYADRAMLERMVGLAEVGIYGIGYSIGMMMVVLVDGAFGSAWPPYFAQFVNRREEACRLFGRVLRY